LNIPGSQTSQQEGPSASIPGLGSSYGGASGLNTSAPGESDSQSELDAANAAIAGDVGQANSLIDQGMQGGVNGLNIPTTSGSSVTQTDNSDSGSSWLTSIWNSLTGGSGNGGGNGGANAGTSGAGTNAGNGESTGANSANTQGPSNAGATEQGGSWVAGTAFGSAGSSTDKNGTTTSFVTGEDGTNTFGVVIVSGKDGNGTNTNTTYNGTTGELNSVTTGPISFGRGGKNNMPSDDSSGGSTHPTGGLANGSAPTQTGNAGGTGNNSDANSGPLGGLASGSSLANKGHGDGSGDAGDNGPNGKTGALASNSSLATRNQGDGGGSDTRGGGSSTSATSGKAVNPGGSHNQLTGATATAN
jgi:hypothetical protein